MKSDESPSPPPADTAETASSESPTRPPLEDADASALTSAKEDEAREATSSAAPPTPSKASQTPEAWGATARAASLSFLIGMAIVVAVRLSTGGEWVIDFLEKNKFPMTDRMSLIGQSLVGGA